MESRLHAGKGTVVLVRHRIHSGGFRAYALHFVSVFGSAKAGIHRDKLGGGIKSTASSSAWGDDHNTGTFFWIIILPGRAG